MTGNCQVRFLEGWAAARPPGYSIIGYGEVSWKYPCEFSWLLCIALPVGCFALFCLFCFGQGIGMQSRPRRARSSRECISMRLEPDTVWTIVGVEAQPDIERVRTGMRRPSWKNAKSAAATSPSTAASRQPPSIPRTSQHDMYSASPECFRYRQGTSQALEIGDESLGYSRCCPATLYFRNGYAPTLVARSEPFLSASAGVIHCRPIVSLTLQAINRSLERASGGTLLLYSDKDADPACPPRALCTHSAPLNFLLTATGHGSSRQHHALLRRRSKELHDTWGQVSCCRLLLFNLRV